MIVTQNKPDYREIVRLYGQQEASRQWRLNNPSIAAQKRDFTNTPPICPCCGQHSFKVCGNYEICSTCRWEDDPSQREDHDYGGGANELSLNEHRQKWLNRKA